MGLASPLAVIDRLRVETGEAHSRLERALALSPETLTRDIVARLLLRFRTFYSVWEPWIEASPLDRGFLAPRLKSPLIDRDIRALGLTVADRPASGRFDMGAPSVERALGSLYVVEGSTLGGQVINRWLGETAWLPAGGLAYFASYGRDVGRMWRVFQTVLCEAVLPSAHDEVVASATATFEHMHACLCGREEVA